VEFVSTHHRAHLLRDGVEAFEDGTVSFLAIPAARDGLEFLASVGLERVRRHVATLGDALAGELRAMRHRGGAPMVRVYGPADGRDRGATLAFNVLDRRGRAIPYQLVEAAARDARVSVRGGCFCNPGAAAAAFGFPPDATIRCLDGARRVGWSLDRFSRCLGGLPVGAVRASLGIPSDEHDIARLVEVVAELASRSTLRRAVHPQITQIGTAMRPAI
jgi:selenocysteine lyase/cysteine desulfurase